MKFRILYQDPHLIAIDKPSGLEVHPHEDPAHRNRSSRHCLGILRRQIDQYLYPVHRLDSATSGVLIFALDSPTAREISRLFQERKVAKTYYCVTRGWCPEEETIDRPLTSESDRTQKIPALTRISLIARMEHPSAVGRYATARYSLVRAEPATGRHHQIRRHLAGRGYPLIGDTVHGDGEHNRFFREALGIPGLLLKAQAIELPHPMRPGESLRIESRWSGKWHRVFELFGTCPIISPRISVERHSAG